MEITCVNGENRNTHVKNFCDYMRKWKNGK